MSRKKKYGKHKSQLEPANAYSPDLPEYEPAWNMEDLEYDDMTFGPWNDDPESEFPEEVESSGLYDIEIPQLCKIVEDTSGVRNRKAKTLSVIARSFAEREQIIVVGNTLYRYDEDEGCYYLLQHPERAIEQYLPFDQADQLTKRDFEEIVERIKRISYLERNPDSFNCNATQLNCQSGVIDLSVDPFQVNSHTPSIPFTYSINAKLIPEWLDVGSPIFDQFCCTSLDGNAEKRQLLLEIIGYMLSDATGGKCACFLKGAPNSGKSVIADFICHLFDTSLVSNVPLHKLSDRFNKAELFGKKINVCGEIKAKKLTDITIFKMVTGGDIIQAEYKGQDPFTFRPRCKLLFSGNALPGTAEADSTAAFVNRLVVLLFNHSVPPEEQDKTLLDKLLQERDAIFTLAMRAFYDLKCRNFVFTLPEDSRIFLQSFTYSENSVRAFVEDCCVPDHQSKIFNRDILNAYTKYCRVNGLEVRPKQQLYDAVDAIPGVEARRLRIGPENCRGRIGIRILSANGTVEHEKKTTAPQHIDYSTHGDGYGTVKEPYLPDFDGYIIQEGECK